MRLVVILFTAVLLSGCAGVETPEQLQARLSDESAAARREIEAATAVFERGINRGNLDSMVSIMAEDVRMLPPNSPVIEGPGQFRAWMNPRLGAGSIQEKLITEDVVASGPLAVETGTYTLVFTPRSSDPAGAPVTADTGKYIWQWARAGDRWLLKQAIWNSSRAPAPAQ